MKIFASVLYDGQEKFADQVIEIKETKIQKVGPGNGNGCNFSGFVTPAFIDAHSHIGMERQGEPSDEGEANDEIDQITPLNNPLNSIYFDDRAFEEAVDFGVLYSCVVPGSGNILGGKAVIIRNFGKNREEAFISHYGYKMALGYNPRSTDNWKGTRPTTRMGVYSLLEHTFDEVLLKREKERLSLEDNIKEIEDKSSEHNLSDDEIKERLKIAKREYELEFSEEDRALLEMLNGKKVCKVHVHKEDDLMYLLELKKKYKLKITAEHLSDVNNPTVFERLANEKIPVVYGPVGTLDYKVELKNGSYKNVRHIIGSGVTFGLMTDHPVLLSYNIADQLKFFLMNGMNEAEAISLLTKNNAEILGLSKTLGTVEKGKLASLIVWDRDPFYAGACPLAVIAEGQVIRQRSL